jgi:transcription initiation factor TFIIIB Brf1 subunit/transcription initiation factor TFIIB
MQCPECGSDQLVKNGRAGSNRQRYTCKDCGHRTTNPEQDSVPAVKFNTKLPKSKRYVITSAQNATPVFKPFLASLRHFCKRMNAELIVIPFRYKNPTSQWTADNESHEWWASEIVPHLYDGRFDIHPHLTVLADIKVQPTATHPLTTLESITGGKSGLVGHPKISLKTVATPQHTLPKIMASTGALTVPNYTDTKAGKKGEFHHTFGAALVELRGKNVFHLRQIVACNDGSFTELDIEATAKGTRKAPPALGVTLADTHARFISKDVVRATFTAPDSIVRILRPQYLVWHDVIDFHTRNHHHLGDWLTQFGKWQAGRECVRAELQEACTFIDEHTPDGSQSVVVASNHHEAMLRWIKETDPRSDPVNAEFLYEVGLELLRKTRMGSGGVEIPDPFILWGKKYAKTDVRFLDMDESFVLGGVEHGLHGHKGPNGARGSTKNLSRIGVKVTKGHSHAPGIEEGCYSVGKSTDKLEYEAGPGGHMNTHCVQYANGKRSLINIIGGSWRLEP